MAIIALRFPIITLIIVFLSTINVYPPVAVRDIILVKQPHYVTIKQLRLVATPLAAPYIHYICCNSLL